MTLSKEQNGGQGKSLQAVEHYDVLIVGCGIAGLSVALEIPAHLKVCILSKGSLSQSSSYYAQGGIAAAVNANDSPQQHAEDTINAGNGLCKAETVQQVVNLGEAAITWLQAMGVEFNRVGEASHDLHLAREGGHSNKRIVHHYDGTGKTVQLALYEKALARKNIEILSDFIAVDLIVNQGQCCGAYALNKTVRKIHTISAGATVLATGGACKTYLYTTNPDSSSGDGIAMAYRAGCAIANMQFIQFHPTGLYHPDAKSFLISEALRGEGAKLTLPDGTEFMQNYSDQKELAPRDIVARAIDHEMKIRGLDYVHLDISHREKEFILESFPVIYQRCLEFGYDLTRQAIPVVPMAHYTCGGIDTRIDGATEIESLYAVGEVASNGLHGANRLASNSLLECVVCGRMCATAIATHKPTLALQDLDIPAWDESRVADPDQEVIITHGWNQVRQLMWDYVGIVRSYDRLLMAKKHIDLLLEEADEHYKRYKINTNSIEFRNLALVASLIIHSALLRKESRGLHYIVEYPRSDPKLHGVDTVITRSE